jgi:hypothetical protein
MAEESETPGGESGPGGTQPGGPGQSGGLGPGGLGRGTEGDLLAERRARRAAESGDAALIRRAEAAEATVRTLETHVASLQQRLREAEVEGQRVSELIEAERITAGAERRSTTEQELRLAKQREYAEQQLRVEAEDRCIDLERESRAEVERLGRRLSASERGARELAGQLETVERALAEAEQAAAAELVSVRRAGDGFQVRLTALERRALQVQEGLEAERAARERTERLLESVRRGHRRMEGLLGELGGMVARLRAALATAPGPTETAPDRFGRPETPASPPPPALTSAPQRPETSLQHPPTAAGGLSGERDRGEMTEALAAAVVRLRARVEEVGEVEDRGRQAGASASPQLVYMSPPREPLVPRRRMSWWSARRARRRSR